MQNMRKTLIWVGEDSAFSHPYQRINYLFIASDLKNAMMFISISGMQHNVNFV